MEIKQNPFSLYDFLGYFIPGALLVLASAEVYVLLAHTGSLLDFGSIETYLPFTLLSYVLGHLLSFFSSVTVEKYSIWKLGYPSKYLLGLPFPHYYDVKKPKTARYFYRSIIAIFLLPISVFDIVLGKFLSLNELHAKSLDTTMVDILRGHVQDLFGPKKKPKKKKKGKLVNAADMDYFRFAYHLALERAPGHFQKMQNYVALYGFLRTLCFITVLAFWGGFFYILKSPSQSWFLLLVPSFLAYIIYLDFNKFYRRFSLEVLMAISAITNKT